MSFGSLLMPNFCVKTAFLTTAAFTSTINQFPSLLITDYHSYMHNTHNTLGH